MLHLLPELLAKVREVERTLKELGDMLEKFLPSDTDPRYTRLKK